MNKSKDSYFISQMSDALIKSNFNDIQKIMSHNNTHLNQELISASGACSLKDILLLVSKGANPHYKNGEALLMAATFGNIEVVKYYVQEHQLSTNLILNDKHSTKSVKQWAMEYNAITLKNELDNKLEHKSTDNKKLKI